MSEFWSDCVEHLRNRLSPKEFDAWIQPLSTALAGDRLTILAPSRKALEWVRDTYLPTMQDFAASYDGSAPELDIEVAIRQASAQPIEQDVAGAPADAVVRPANGSARSDGIESSLSENFTFDTFVTGKANQFARAAALQVAEHPGRAYNPLFLYGGTGLGKTHLVQAIGNHVKSANPDARILYIHAEKYVSDVVRAYQNKSFDAFKRYYHSLDLLLIDDIQFFSGKNRTQEEFFYAFNTLADRQKQIVITCDTYPKQMEGIDERLRTRFAWGLTVEIEPPELEMRVAILLRKANTLGMTLPQEVAFFVARHFPSNVRELEGALNRIHAYVRFKHCAVDMDSVREALRDILAVALRQVSIEQIQKAVADYYKLKVAEMHSKRRSRSVARPRQVAMALAKELTNHSLPDIGGAFGGRDHTTVLHACRQIVRLRQDDDELERDYQMLLQQLRG
ncbi:MAG: chromosomal replication initiator protein DnaA [Pseudomonadota bacterium]